MPKKQIEIGTFFRVRLKELKRMIKESKTEIQREHREWILEKVEANIKEALYRRDIRVLYQDYEVFSSLFLTANNGLPLMPSKWQSEATQMALDNQNFCLFSCRRAGKTTWASSFILWNAVNRNDWRAVILAPTKRQSFVFENIYDFFIRNEALKYLFAVGANSKINKELILLDNFSKLISRNIGIHTKGATLRGESANALFIDEFQLIDGEVFTAVIDPILKDAYSEKSLYLFGTPSLYHNPKLEEWVDMWKKSEKWGVLRVPWTRAVEEGCLLKDEVEHARLIMTPDLFLMEYEAEFPSQTGRFFPIEALNRCGQPYRFISQGLASREYYMSIDLARHKDRTEILIAEVGTDGSIKVVAWERIYPEQGLSYDDIAIKVKGWYRAFMPSTIIVDTTTHQEMFVSLLTSGVDAIPIARFYTEGKRVGFVATVQRNSEMWSIHRRMIMATKFNVPNLEVEFFNEWKRQHNELIVKENTSERIILKEPPNGYKDLAVASAMLSYAVFHRKSSKPAKTVGIFTEKPYSRLRPNVVNTIGWV